MDDENPSKAEQKVVVDFGAQNPSNLSTKGLIMVCTGTILLVGCIIIIIFYLYSLKRNHNRRRHHHLHLRNNRIESSSDDAISRGLEPSILRTLSDFRFGSSKYAAGVGAVPPKECAVCLSEFEDDEIGRVLPNCKHSFHLQCIDIWFKFNSNCPLCRTQVQPAVIIKNNLDDDDVVVVGLESGLSSVLNHPSPVSQGEEIVVVVEEDDDQMVICSTSTYEDKKLYRS